MRAGLAVAICLTSSAAPGAAHDRAFARVAAVTTAGVLQAAPVARGRGRVPGWTWFETQVWRLTNAERVKAGRKPLAPNPCLRDVAAVWSRVLHARGNLSHGNFPARIRKCTALRRYSGENVAYGYQRPAGLVAAWMSSPRHRANIMDRSFRYLGVGAAGRQTIYTAQVFAAGGRR